MVRLGFEKMGMNRLFVAMGTWICLSGGVWHGALMGSVQTAYATEERSFDSAKVQEVISALTEMRNIAADFIQINPNGSSTTGKFWLERPMRLRMDYEETVGLRLITAGQFLVQMDFGLETTSYIPISSTPAEFFLRDPISFDGLEIIEFSEKAKILRIRLRPSSLNADDSESELVNVGGSVTLVFERTPGLRLTRWNIEDVSGSVTSITLMGARFNQPIDPDVFAFRDPWAFSNGR